MENKNIFWLQLVIGLLCGLVAAGVILLASRPSRESTIKLPEAPPEAGITVDISGAVSHEGVFELPAGAGLKTR
jgi:hypothetical protein